MAAQQSTVVERVLAVTGVTHRDERIYGFNTTLYALTLVCAFISYGIVWCTRKTLLKFTCLTPIGCCCSAPPSASKSRSVHVTGSVPGVVVATARTAQATSTNDGGAEMVHPTVVTGVPVCGGV